MVISERVRFSILGLIVMTGVARADPAAEALFQEGRELVKSGKLDEACDRFTRSETLEPMVGTAFNLGDCREHQGRLADAWEAFVTARALARANDTRGTVAAERAAALAPRLAHLTIAVTGARPAGLAITRNGAPVAPEVLDIEIPIDPGTYELVAAAPGFHSRSMRVALSLGTHATATIPALEAIAEPPPEPPASVPAPARAAVPSLASLSVGAAFGGTSGSDVTGGFRLVGSSPVPGGAVRATLQGLFTSLGNADPGQTLDHYALGLGLDYLWPWGHGLASAGGFAVGKTWIDDSYQTMWFSTNWIALEASPLIVQLAGPRLELGLHVKVMLHETATESPAEASPTVAGVLGLDWFLW